MKGKTETATITLPFVRTPYNYDMNAAGDASGIACNPEEGKTQQHFSEDADINTIVKRFGLTGMMPQNLRPPMTGDFTEMVTDYRSALELVREADRQFMSLPPEARFRFNNDPHEFIRFVEDPKNLDEARKLGLAAPAAQPPSPAAPPGPTEAPGKSG